MIAPFARSSAMSGESVFGASMAKLTSLPPVERMSFASYQFLMREHDAVHRQRLAGRDSVPYCASSSAARSSASGCLRNSSHYGRRTRRQRAGRTDARRTSPLQVTDRSPRMLSVSSAFSWPAFGMPTRMPNCCCTLGSEMRRLHPAELDRQPGVLRRSPGARSMTGTVSSETRAACRRARCRCRRNRRAVGRHERRADAVVRPGAVDVRLHDGSAGRVCPDLMAACTSAIVASSIWRNWADTLCIDSCQT